LFLALAGITSLGWIVFWWTRRVNRNPPHERILLNPEP